MESDFLAGFGLLRQLSPRFFSVEKSLSKQRPRWDILVSLGLNFKRSAKILPKDTIPIYRDIL
jgi:hypothetical protein